MERNVDYATMVSTGEQPDITIHLTGFNEGDGIRFHTKVEGKKIQIICAIEEIVSSVFREFKDDDEDLAQFYVISVTRGIVEAVGAETFKKAFINMIKGGDI